MPNRKRDCEGRFNDAAFFIDAVRDRPDGPARQSAGAAWPAAGAFLWSRRDQIGEALNSGMDRLSELKAERMGVRPTQEEIAEEALTLKETGKNPRAARPDRPAGHQGRNGRPAKLGLDGNGDGAPSGRSPVS